MIKLYLTNGGFTLIDKKDWGRVSKYKWCKYQHHNTIYVRNTDRKNGKIFLHRFIINAQDNDVVDHINGNGLDNRKCNLRICTNQQNIFNSCAHKDSFYSDYKGISYDRSRKKWVAQLTFNYKRVLSRRFNNEIEAAKAYNIAAIKYFGKYAYLNIIKE